MTKENGNISFNFSILLVFPWGRLFKVCHESLQIHKTTCMCYLILLRSICIAWEKENELGLQHFSRDSWVTVCMGLTGKEVDINL